MLTKQTIGIGILLWSFSSFAYGDSIFPKVSAKIRKEPFVSGMCWHVQVGNNADPIGDNTVQIDLHLSGNGDLGGTWSKSETLEDQLVTWEIKAIRSMSAEERLNLQISLESDTGKSKNFDIHFGHQNEMLIPYTETTLRLGAYDGFCYTAVLGISS